MNVGVLQLVGLVLMPVLLALSGMCSGAETGLFSLTHADRLRLRKTHPDSAAFIAALLAQPRSLLVVILLANMMVNTCYFTLAALVGGKLLNTELQAAGFGAACVLGIILFGEVLPKAIAAAHRVTVSRVVCRPVMVWFRLLAPVRTVMDRFVIAPLSRLFRAEVREEQHRLTSQDLSSLLEVGGRQGVLRADEQQLLADVVQLSELRVRDVMTPRVDVRWLDAVGTSQELLQVARDTGWTRFPVCRGAFDERQLVGLVNAQRVLPVLYAQGAASRLPLTSLVEPARFVPERARVDQLLDRFRSERIDMALVVNEHGQLTGMVQIEQVIDELVRFTIAHEDAPDPQVQRVSENEWEASGRMSIHDWEEFFEPSGYERRAGARVSTLAGLILARLGRLPKPGDEVTIGNVTLRVASMQARNIERVRIGVAPDTRESESAA